MAENRGTQLLSRDIASGIRYFCFNNISEFFERYRNKLSMSRATFFRALNGEYVLSDYVAEIEVLTVELGINDERGGSSIIVDSWIRKKLVYLVENLLNKFTPESINALKEFMDQYKANLLS